MLAAPVKWWQKGTTTHGDGKGAVVDGRVFRRRGVARGGSKRRQDVAAMMAGERSCAEISAPQKFPYDGGTEKEVAKTEDLG